MRFPYRDTNSWHALQTSRGVVLPLALFLLVVISIIGVMVISNSTSSEKTIQSLRSNAMAQQAAEIALRYCEGAVMEFADNSGTTYASLYDKFKDTSAVTSQDDSDALWRDADEWKSTGAHRIVIPSSTYKKDATGNFNGDLKHAPMCIAQKLGSKSYLITARGFGNDAAFGSDGKVKTGAEIWLQSTITPES